MSEPCTSCGKNKAVTPVLSTPAAASAVTVRPSCLNCCVKHAGESWIIDDLLKSNIRPVPSQAVLSRAETLWTESRNGYPQHLYMAIGCLALVSQVYMTTGQTAASESVRTVQKALEDNPAVYDSSSLHTLPDVPVLVSPSMVIAQLMEAMSETYADFPTLVTLLRQQLILYKDTKNLSMITVIFTEIDRLKTIAAAKPETAQLGSFTSEKPS